MQRRDFVRVMMAMGVAPRLLLGQQANPAPPPPAPVPWTLGLNPKTPLPVTTVEDAVAQEDLLFFSPEQMGTLTRLCSLLLPSIEGKPGALEAQAPAFLDFLIGSSPDVRKTLYGGGLDWLDAQAKATYGVPFAQTQPAQADALVKPWLRTWMTDHPPTEAHADFLNVAHADIRTATLNSEAWIKASPAPGPDSTNALGLYWSPIDPDVYAADPNRFHVRPTPTAGAPTSATPTPAYPQ